MPRGTSVINLKLLSEVLIGFRTSTSRIDRKIAIFFWMVSGNTVVFGWFSAARVVESSSDKFLTKRSRWREDREVQSRSWISFSFGGGGDNLSKITRSSDVSQQTNEERVPLISTLQFQTWNLPGEGAKNQRRGLFHH